MNVFGNIPESGPDSNCELVLRGNEEFEIDGGVEEFGDGEQGEELKSKPGKKKECSPNIHYLLRVQDILPRKGTGRKHTEIGIEFQLRG